MNEHEKRVDYIVKSVAQDILDGYSPESARVTHEQVSSLGAIEVAKLYKLFREVDSI